MSRKSATSAVAPGVVCDRCKNWLGQQVDAPFADRFDMKLTRGLERARGRTGRIPDLIDGHNAVARLDVEIDGAKVSLYVARADPWGDGGLEIELLPKLRDPPDVVARTIRALWKIVLESFWVLEPERAMSPDWDHLRHAVLGAPFKGYLLQAPFMAMVTRRLAVNANFDAPEDPCAMTFEMGGVALAVPLASGVKLVHADARCDGWEVHTTAATAPRTIHLRLDPSTAADSMRSE